jgi:hypothetical protein
VIATPVEGETLAGWLNAAADILEGQEVLAQGDLRDPDGNVCVREAMNLVTPREHCFDVGQAFAEHVGVNVRRICDWNDTPGRTVAEAVQALRDAAIKQQPDATTGW